METLTYQGEERLSVSPGEFAELFGTTRQHVQNMIRLGEIASVKLGARRCIPVTEVRRLLGQAPAAGGAA